MFALESLALAGETASTSTRVAKACEFLLSKQQTDGGWGESFAVSFTWSPLARMKPPLIRRGGQSCETREYVQHEQSQVVNTAFAVIGLLAARSNDEEAIRRGCRLIMARQLDNGEWAQEAIEGGECSRQLRSWVKRILSLSADLPLVFNHTCGISCKPNVSAIVAPSAR